MNFRRGRFREEPEINFIPLIDVLLVILIFLMASTTYSKFTELKISLPEAEAEKQAQRPKEIQVAATKLTKKRLPSRAWVHLRSR
jgi:biopolymer transport protein ExbD